MFENLFSIAYRKHLWTRVRELCVRSMRVRVDKALIKIKKSGKSWRQQYFTFFFFTAHNGPVVASVFTLGIKRRAKQAFVRKTKREIRSQRLKKKTAQPPFVTENLCIYLAPSRVD